MTHHILKIESTHWSAKQRFVKPFEVRKDDQGFQVGDTVSYSTQCDGKWHIQPEVYEIIYILREYQLEGYVTFAEKLIDVDADIAAGRNQCDGCNANLIVKKGIHYDSSDHPVMACCANQYTGETK